MFVNVVKEVSHDSSILSKIVDYAETWTAKYVAKFFTENESLVMLFGSAKNTFSSLSGKCGVVIANWFRHVNEYTPSDESAQPFFSAVNFRTKGTAISFA